MNSSLRIILTRIHSAGHAFCEELMRKERPRTAEERALAAQLGSIMNIAERSDFLADLRRMREFNGIYAGVAREMNCSPQHVRHVAIGSTKSARVLAALEKRYREIEKQIDQQNGGEK